MTRFLIPRARAITIAALLLGVALVSMIMPGATASPSLDASEGQMCRLINDYRTSQGLPPLKVSIDLNEASDWHTDDMVAKNYLSHTDSLGRSPFQRMDYFGYTDPTSRGENIAAGNSSAPSTFTQWKNSPTHNTNMLSANYKVIGIAKTSGTGTTYGHYWNTTFGGKVDAGATVCPGTSPSPTPTPTTPPKISINDVSVAEGNLSSNTATFTVKLSKAAGGPVSVNYWTSAGTAAHNSDYIGKTGTLNIPAGQTSATIRVTIVRDRVKEPDETFSMNLASPAGATISDAKGIGTIRNDD